MITQVSTQHFPVSDWYNEGTSSSLLENLLTSMYWEGAVRELGATILSLKRLEDVSIIPEEGDIEKRVPTEALDFGRAWGMFQMETCQ
jgi:hypothetical protein